MKVYIREMQENYCLGDFEAQMLGSAGSNKFILEGNGKKFFFEGRHRKTH